MRAKGTCALVSVALVGAAWTPGARAVTSGSPPAAKGPFGYFYVTCRFGHAATDDPIVKPAMPGASHSHDFFGNASTNYASTAGTLAAERGLCSAKPDRSGYWIPTLYQDGTPIAAQGATALYAQHGHAAGTIRPFPFGLKVVAGDAKATSPQSPDVVRWGCSDGSNQGSSVPACPSGARLVLGVLFPDCWDGVNLDSADHRSHMAYSTRGACPATHPVAVPKLKLLVQWPLSGGPGITLSSGGAITAHADFFDAWEPAALQGLVDRCLNGQQQCGQIRN